MNQNGFHKSPSFLINVGKKISGVIYIFKILLAFYFKLKSHWNQLINWFQILPSFIKCWKLHMGLEIFQITPQSCLPIFFELVGAKTNKTNVRNNKTEKNRRKKGNAYLLPLQAQPTRASPCSSSSPSSYVAATRAPAPPPASCWRHLLRPYPRMHTMWMSP